MNRDYAKTGILYFVPPYIAKFGRPLPYFMRYRKDYYRRQKLSKSNSNMNRLCWELEKWERSIRWKRTFSEFDYRIMIDESIPEDVDKVVKVEQVYLEFCNDVRRLMDDQKTIRTEYGEFLLNWQYYYDKYRDKCAEICPDEKELGNIVVRLAYEKYPKKKKNFMWIVAGNGIVHNIKSVPVKLPQHDLDGDVEYLGKRYRMEELIID